MKSPKLACLPILLLTLAAPAFSQAGKTQPNHQILYSFQGQPDGANPEAGVIMGANGTLYGTTEYAGAYGGGAVFSLDSSGKETVIHSFAGSPDGQAPLGSLVEDSFGNLYGTTYVGGSFSNKNCDPVGCGTVFKIDSTGTETVLYSFAGGTDGQSPLGSLVMDADGSLYGTTSLGGSSKDYGTVFKVGQGGTESVLYSFSGGTDGGDPQANLVFDTEGNLYGTAERGGTSGFGVIFKLTPHPDGTWTETVLHSFSGRPDGYGPLSGLTWDDHGNLYGTTWSGGKYVKGRCDQRGCGTIFKLSPSGKETIVHRFGVNTGKYPYSSAIFDSAGNLYGVTPRGGVGGGNSCCGLVYKISSAGRESVLHMFGSRKNDGSSPLGTPIRDAEGNLYGTTQGGGSNRSCELGCGTVFKITP